MFKKKKEMKTFIIGNAHIVHNKQACLSRAPYIKIRVTKLWSTALLKLE